VTRAALQVPRAAAEIPGARPIHVRASERAPCPPIVQVTGDLRGEAQGASITRSANTRSPGDLVLQTGPAVVTTHHPTGLRF